MDDTISRKAAIDAVTDELDMIDHVPQWVFDRLEKRLKQLPSTQPEPSQVARDIATIIENEKDMRVIASAQRTGRWIWSKNGMDWGLGAWCCSECRTKAETWWATDKKYNPLMCSGGKFCGNCGARMEGDNG